MFVTTGSVLAVTIGGTLLSSRFSPDRWITREINKINENPDRDIDSNGNTSNHQKFHNKLYNQFNYYIYQDCWQLIIHRALKKP